MMTSVETCLRRGRRKVRQWAGHPRVRLAGRIFLYSGSGFVLSAASLMNQLQPLALGLTASLTGWRVIAAGLGSLIGYRLFWDTSGWQGAVWIAAGMAMALLLGKREALRKQPMLMSALCALVVSATGVAFQLLHREDTTLPVYLTRVLLSAASTELFTRVLRRGDALMDWLAGGTAVLTLSQISPIPWLNPGCIAAGVLAMTGPFPAAALAGLGLDLSRITPVPMTAVLCLCFLSRLVPMKQRWLRMAAPGMICIAVMGLCGTWDPLLLPGLILGSALGFLIPSGTPLHHRRGETGLAQVRLELSARILAETRRLFLETESPAIDRDSILEKVRQNACSSCSARNVCPQRDSLSTQLLLQPMDAACRKPGRLIPELRRGQEQLRLLTAQRRHREEYRQALGQQYQFLSEYLQQLADQLPRRGHRVHTLYRIQCSARSQAREQANGDRCISFPGTGGLYYVLLCDGMGTGLGAAREGDSAAALLQRMITLGFPASHALRSLNSLLLLRGKTGAVTMDLAEADLAAGAVTLYKWGAAPSWLLKRDKAEKIGTATPPPGLSVEDTRETVTRLSLRRGEALILLSDGMEVGETLSRMELTPEAPPGELAQALLDKGCRGDDDATVAVIRLQRLRQSEEQRLPELST